MLIRAFRAADAPAVRGLIAELQRHEHALDPSIARGAGIAARYFASVRRRMEAAFVAERGGRVVGFVSMWLDDTYEDLDSRPVRYVYVSDLIVGAADRRRGIGRALMREAERWARARRVRQVRLNVLARNPTARAAYRALGYREVQLSLARRV